MSLVTLKNALSGALVQMYVEALSEESDLSIKERVDRCCDSAPSFTYRDRTIFFSEKEVTDLVAKAAAFIKIAAARSREAQ